MLYLIDYSNPTCIMSTVHSSMVVANSIQIIEEFWGYQLPSLTLLPGSERWRVDTMVVVNHVRRHVQAI